MFEKIYLKDCILSYNKVINILNTLMSKYDEKISCNFIGKTNFNYNINSYTIGRGKKDVLLIGATHSNEIVTTYFILEFIVTLLENYDLLYELLNNYTFHFIPILNIDGYIITTSNIITNFTTFSNDEIENLSTKYLNVYNKDDEIAKSGVKVEKQFYNILKADINNIQDLCLKKSVEKILKDAKLDDKVLNIWSANGLGIDQNSNSIHKFKEIKKLRKMQRFANLRYNDIPVTRPSPMSYPGLFTFDRSPENKSLYDYIKYLYCKRNLKFVFSFHSTGGEVYGLPSCICNTKRKIDNYNQAIIKYCNITGYEKMDDKYKYGVMDYYREYLNNTICLTIELSKLNANPIGPFSDLEKLDQEIILNKRAIISVISDKNIKLCN